MALYHRWFESHCSGEPGDNFFGKRFHPLPNVDGVYEAEEGHTFLTLNSAVSHDDL